MGCNCKSGKVYKLNNLDSQDHINQAREVWERVIATKTVQQYDELDTREIMSTYKSLYPNAKYVPSIENAIENINHAINNFRKR